MLLPFALGLPSLGPVGPPSSENVKKTGYLSDGGSHISSDSEVSLLAAQEGDWSPGLSGDLGSQQEGASALSGGGREVWMPSWAPLGWPPDPEAHPVPSPGCALAV